jgi:transaldolase
MTPIELLHDEGQSLWLDHATRRTIAGGAFARAMDRLGVTGLASDPAALLRAIAASSLYDGALRTKAREGKRAEESLFEIVLEDAVQAADLLRATWDRTSGADGWVSAPLSPFLSASANGALAAAADLSDRACRPNLLVEIPGTSEGLIAVEQSIFAGISVNVTSLFSAAQYRGAADAYLRGLEHRFAAGLDGDVGSVASVSLDCRVRGDARQPAGFAAGREVYRAYRRVLRSPRWQRLFRMGARPQRVLWTRKATNDAGYEFLYARALANPFTISVMSMDVLDLFSSRGSLCTATRAVPVNARPSTAEPESEDAALRLQRDALELARDTWRAIAASIDSKDTALDRAG